MEINEYQRLALRTASPEVMDNPILNGTMGLCGESGECIDILKKHLFQGHELDKDKLKKELGDVAWYLAISSYALGLSLEDVLQANVDKLMKRYPEGFDLEHSLHREGEI